jgi:iron complex outermembrane receptor protein
MKILAACLFAGFIMGVCNYSYAQINAGIIQGRVTVENHIPGDLATVILLAGDSAILKSVICDNTGSYKFKDINPGTYLILASKIGFNQSLAGPYTLTPGSVISANVKLTPSVPQLKEVAINAQRAYVEVKPGKMTLNVQSSIIAEGNSAFDILRQAPGVKMDNNQNISIIGRQNALITIDGKPTALAGDGLTSFLQGMPSNAIQQIELITNPSAKYDAAGGGIINIISRKGTNIGTNGAFTAGLGYGNFYKANAGIVFNNRTDKFNVYGNYSHTSDRTFHTIITDRLINYNGLASDYNANYYATQQRNNDNFKLGADYFISGKQTLGVLVYGTITNNDFVKTNALKIANNAVYDSTITTNSKLTRNFSNMNYDINYNGVFDKSGSSLSADVLYNNINRHSVEYITDNFYNAQGNSYRQPLNLQNLSPSGIRNWVSKVDYTKTLTKTSKLEAGIKYSWVQSNNDLIFGPLVNGQYQRDPNFSNTFIYTENVNSTYVNYTNNLNKLNIVAGLRAEQTNSSGNSVTLMQDNKKSYLDLFPQVQLIYNYNEKNDFTFSFNRGIQRPLYTDINPFLYYVDAYDYRSGNPGLLPEYTTNLQLAHIYNKNFITTLYASKTTGFYGFNDFEQNDATKVDITIIKNFGTFAAFGLKFFAPVTFADWWAANFLLDASYQRTNAYAINGDLNKGTQDIVFSTDQNFTISNTVKATISGKYESPTFYGISQYKSAYNADAGISQQLFGKKGSLKLSVDDIFNTIRDRATSNYQNLALSIMDKKETRVVRLSLTYRFGKTSVKAIKHQTANEDEQKRAAGN